MINRNNINLGKINNFRLNLKDQNYYQALNFHSAHHYD